MANSLPVRSPRPIRLLEQTLWGQAVRYRLKRLESTFEKLPTHDFLCRPSGDYTDAAIMRLPKNATILHKARRCLYLSLFAVRPESQGKGLGTALLKEALEQCENFDLVYAYIEADNWPSRKVFQKAGFKELHEFRAVVLSRYAPKLSTGTSSLEPDEKSYMTTLLNDLYRNHALCDFETSLDPKSYWVVRDSAGIVAGAQIYPQEWAIEEMKGPDGWFLMNIFPRLPRMKRLFNPDPCRFLKLGNLYARPGEEKRLMELIEHQMARHGLNTALAYVDPQSPVYKRLKATGSLGLLHALMQFPVVVSCLPIHLTPQEVDKLQQGPLVLSPIDVG